MSERNEMIEAGARAIGVATEPAWLDDVAANLAVLLRFGNEVAAFPLPDETEPAPVFRGGA